MSVTYCTAEDVYLASGLNSEVIGEPEVEDAILDAEAEIDEYTGRSWGSSAYHNEKFYFKDRVSKLDENSVVDDYLIFRYTPILGVTTISLLDKTNSVLSYFASTEYTFDATSGKFEFFDHDLYESPNYYDVTYTAGYASVPRKIKRATSILAAMKILISQTGGTYDDITSYSLGGYSASLGEPWTNIEATYRKLEAEWQRLLSIIGMYGTFVISVDDV